MELEFITELAQNAMEQKVPMFGQFELTPVCNLKCHMCYIHRPEEDGRNAKMLLPVSFWLEKARQAKEMGMLVLSITGGETMLYPEIEVLMEELSCMGFLISLNTNGTLLDEKKIAWLKKNPPTKVNISLYGASDETYERLCGMKDGFYKVSRGIALLQEAGLNVYLNTTLVPENIGDLPKMHEFAAKRGLELHCTSYVYPARGCQGSSCSIHRFTPLEAADAACFDKVIKGGRDAFRKYAATMSFALDQAEQQEVWADEFKKCRAGNCSFSINWRGELQPCALFDAGQVNVIQKDFSEAWKELVEWVDGLKTPKKCNQCRKQMICPVCKAAVFQETGRFDAVPEYLCEYCSYMEKIAKKEGAGVEFKISDCGDIYYSGCH